MSDQTATTSGHDAAVTAATALFTVEQAAAILGLSVTTVKRRIRAGLLRAEEAHRPQGTVWLVYLDAAATGATEERPSAASVAATAPTTPPAAEAIVSLIQTTIATVPGPLVGQLDAQRQTLERQAGRVAELERENGRQSAELERATSTVVALSDELERLRAPSSPVAGSGGPEVPAPTKGAQASSGPPAWRGCSACWRSSPRSCC
jgi:hypothetical protein